MRSSNSNLALQTPENEGEEGNVIPFRLRTGGGGPRPPQQDNWLLKLDVGTVFLCGSTDPFYALPLTVFQVIQKLEHCVRLQFLDYPDQVPVWVNSRKFSSQRTCDEIMGVVLQEEETSDGNSDRSD